MGVNLTDGNIDKMGIVRVSIDLGNVNANTTSAQLFTVPGVLPGDMLICTQETSTGAYTPGYFVQSAFVTAADTVQLNIANITAAPINISARNFVFAWFRPYQGVTLPNGISA